MKINKFQGLNLISNSYSDTSGSMELAENCIIAQDDTISKRRGYKTFLSAATSSALALIDYKTKLINIGDNELQVYNQNGSGDYSSTTTLSGQTLSVTYPRSAQAGGNAYITCDNFVAKLEDTSSSILKAGVAKAPDLTYNALGSGTSNSPITGIHLPDTQIGYRVVFARNDINSNLIIGAPSELTANNNTLYTASSVSLSTYDVIVTYNSHGLVTGDYVTIRNSNGSVAVPDGEYVLTAYTANTFTFSTSAALSSVPTGVTALSFGIRRAPQLEFTIPSDVDSTAYIYKIYRTNASIAGDVEPDEATLQQIYEANLTSGNLSAGYIQYTDVVDDLFKQGYLYTNPNTGSGILEANFTPPPCRDIASFRNHMFYAYPTWFYSLDINLIRASATTFVNNDYIDVVQISNSKTTTYCTWQSGTTVRYGVSSNTNLQVGQYILFSGFVNSANNGKFIITSVSTTYVDCTNAGRVNGSLDESSLSLTSYPVRRYTAASSESFNTAAGGNFKLSTGSSSVATNIDATARSIVRTINRDTYSNIYMSYTSSSISLPGQMFSYGRTTSSTYAFQASSSTVGANFDPTLPTTTSDITTVVGDNASYANGIAISKQNEYEAVPLTSFLLIGSKTAEIKRIFALKNSLIILKEDGVFRISGNNRSDFLVNQIDPTVIIKAVDSAVVMNGYVYCLTNQGVVQISESSVSIISRNIEPLILALLSNSSVSTQTYGHAQESNRLYLLTTMKPGSTSADVTYVYNSLNNTWTSWTDLFKRGIVKSSDDRYYTVGLNNEILKERKDQTKLDYCGDSTSSVVVNSVASDLKSAVMTSILTINDGDVFVYAGTINRVSSVSGSTITFQSAVNFTAGQTPTHYQRIVSNFTISPIVGENTGTLKQYSEQTLQFRNLSCSSMLLGWITETTETGYMTWNSYLSALGWGQDTWGAFDWGQGETTTLDYTTYINQPSRVFIPIQVQLATWIKLKMKHQVAAETINLQEINIVTRNISSRVSK